MDSVAEVFLSTLIFAAIVISRGFAIVLLWGWFVVPVFHLPAITWRVAYGLALLIWVMPHAPDPEYKDGSWAARMGRSVGSGILEPWLCVVVGWVLK